MRAGHQGVVRSLRTARLLKSKLPLVSGESAFRRVAIDGVWKRARQSAEQIVFR